MTDTYITHATWAPGGHQIDLCLAPAAESLDTIVLIEGIPLPNIKKACPSGAMEIPEHAHVIDASGKLLMPALYDLHTHIEMPGRSKRECIIRAGEAAIRGGVWGMLVLPSPAFRFDNGASLDSFRETASVRSAAEMTPAGCISLGMQGLEQAPYNTLAATRGVHVLSDGDDFPADILMLYRAMQYAGELELVFAVRADVPALTKHTYVHPSATAYKLGLHPCPPCAEEIGTETLIRLAEATGAHLHLQLVSTAESVRIIRHAKERGVKVTAEVALQHLLFTHEKIGDYNTVFKTVPPLRDKADCEALLEGVKDGTIDCIVSAHTPCTPFSKKQDFITAPVGMTGLDTFLPALYTHLVEPGLLTWWDLVRACCLNPEGIACPRDQEEGVPSTAPLLLFDPQVSHVVTEESLVCGALNTPFLGQELHGAVTLPLR